MEESFTITKRQVIAAFFARTLLGIIFLMQGFGKVFTWGMVGVYENVFKSYEIMLPSFLLKVLAYYTSYIELIAGVLLIIGLFRNYALYALGSVLLIVAFGHGMAQPIWDLSHVFPRAILLIIILVMPISWDKWNLDYLIYRKNATFKPRNK